MENSPITLAHTHARNAVLETRRSNPVAASEEHDLAAAEFAHAAQATGDPEALRTLHLLEEHHKRLGQLLRFRHEHPELSQKAETQQDTGEVDPTEKSRETPTANALKPLPSPEALQQPPKLAGGPRPVARDVSSSIASNLASARGIPGSQRRGLPASPTLSPQHAPGKFGKEQDSSKEVQTSRKRSTLPLGERTEDISSDEKHSWAPPAHVTNEESTTKPIPGTGLTTAINDAPFQQFYNTIESLMSKLSAPLAFAGLPLTNTTTPPDGGSEKASKVAHTTVKIEPEYSQMISPAALRAVQGSRSSLNANKNNNAAESFYVVPSTGGTTSYAEIMSRAEREGSRNPRHVRHLSNLSTDTVTEDFVDARESLASPSLSSAPTSQSSQPVNQQYGGRGQQLLHHHRRRSNNPQSPNAVSSTTVNGKTPEELALENLILRHDFDAVTRRLHVFEASSQQTSAALAQSIRFMTRSSNHSTPENSHGKTTKHDTTTSEWGNSGGGAGGEAGEARKGNGKGRSALELEGLLRRNEAELERRERENIKLKDTVGRYRKKWEALKEGAKARREGTAGAGTTGSPIPTGGASASVN